MRLATSVILAVVSRCVACPAAPGPPLPAEGIRLEADTFRGLAQSDLEGWRVDHSNQGTRGSCLATTREGAAVSRQIELPDGGLYDVWIMIAERGTEELVWVGDRSFSVAASPLRAGQRGRVVWELKRVASKLPLLSGTHSVTLQHITDGNSRLGQPGAHRTALVDYLQLVKAGELHEAQLAAANKPLPPLPAAPAPPVAPPPRPAYRGGFPVGAAVGVGLILLSVLVIIALARSTPRR